jgi:hypothetical protein
MNEKKAEGPALVQSETPTMTKVKINITGEANQIIRRAESRDPRVAAVGPLIFFSTDTGDAWMLDAEDGLALCLAQGGKKQLFTITETPTTFGVEWHTTYRIEDDRFLFVEPTGATRTVLGYPTKEILRFSQLKE